MRWEVTMLPVNDYTPEELIEELMPEKYLFNDAGDSIFANIFFNSEGTVRHLIKFLFQTDEIPPIIYRDIENYILDFSAMKHKLIHFDQLESMYQDWLELSGRENSMDEYGMLIDFVGFPRKENRRHLLMVVSKRSE